MTTATEQTAAPAAETAPETTPPVETPAPSPREVLEYDPFENFRQSDEPKPQSAEGEAKPGQAPGKPAAETPPAPPTPPAPTPATGSPATESNLAEVLQRQSTLLSSLVERAQQPAPVQQQEQKPAPKFAMQIPPQIIQAMRSEDESQFSAGLNALMNGVANHVWDQVQQHFTQYDQTATERTREMITRHQSATSEAKRVYDDFYTKYQDLNKPALRPIVLTVAQQLIQEKVARGEQFVWDENFRDTLGTAVTNLLRQALPQPAAPAAPAARFNSGGGGGARPAPAPASAFDF